MAATPDAAARRDALGTVRLGKGRRRLLAFVSIAGLAAAWQAATGLGLIEKVLLPSLGEIAVAFWQSIADGTLGQHVYASLMRVVQGFVLAFALAVPIGVLMGSSQTAGALIDPVVELLRPIPPIAMIPLAILWFGIDEFSKVFIIAYGAFFPILVNTMAGFREVDPVHVRAAQTLGASRAQIFRDVILRSAFPFIVTGARLGMGMAFIVLVAAELIASSEGLGFLITDARYSFRTDLVFLGMACIGVLGFALNRLLVAVEQRLLGWKYARS